MRPQKPDDKKDATTFKNPNLKNRKQCKVWMKTKNLFLLMEMVLQKPKSKKQITTNKRASILKKREKKKRYWFPELKNPRRNKKAMEENGRKQDQTTITKATVNTKSLET